MPSLPQNYIWSVKDCVIIGLYWFDICHSGSQGKWNIIRHVFTHLT